METKVNLDDPAWFVLSAKAGPMQIGVEAEDGPGLSMFHFRYQSLVSGCDEKSVGAPLWQGTLASQGFNGRWWSDD